MIQWARRPLVACILLLAVYVALAFANDPHGYLGTDTGGKVASLRAMERNGHLNPDVGYWAEQWDPSGRVHPLFLTTRAHGKWLNLTTVPMVDAALPLYRLGGYRLALVFPMAGSVLAALAGWALARRLGVTEGWAAATFWLLGLASPLTVYALDFWEHSIGVALLGWAAVLLFDLAGDDGSSPTWWWRALAVGGLVGLAADMRTEAFVYGFVMVGGTCVLWLTRRRLLRAVGLGGLCLFMLLVAVGLNLALEKATIGGTIRSTRAVSAVQAAAQGTSSSDVPSRPREALTTTLALDPGLGDKEAVVGAGVVLLLGMVWWRARRDSPDADQPIAYLASGGLAALLALRAADGLGFVPGLFAASPLAAIGIWGAWRSERRRWLALAAVAALPLVWALQYRGGAVPQWGGRYTLPSAFLLTVVGVALLPALRRWAQVALVGLAVAITAFGLAWLSSRSHGLAQASRALNRQREPVMISTIAHLVREGGGYGGVAGDRRWLSAGRPGDLTFAVDVTRRAGFDEFGLVELDSRRPPSALEGFRPVGVTRVPLLSGLRLRVIDYRQGP